MAGRPHQPPPPIPNLLREPKGRNPRGYDNTGMDMNGAVDPVTRQRTTPASSRPNLSSASALNKASGGDAVQLHKRVGLLSGIALIAGTMIGSGIFVSTRGVMQGTGSVGLALVTWALCGLISLLGALALAELGTLIPKSGCEYAYLSESFTPLGRFGDIPAFLFSWVSNILLKPSSCAIISLTCAEYMLVPLFDDGCGSPPVLNSKMLAAIVMGAVCYCELGTLITHSGAEYSYLLSAMGPFGKFGDLPAFIFAWINTVVLKPSAVAIIILTFATYTTEPFFTLCAAPVIMQKCLAVLAILILMVINSISVKLATGLQNVFTVFKVFALIVIVIGGFVNLGQVLVTCVNIFSVKLASQVQVVFLVAKIIALAVIIVGGLVKLIQGGTQHLSTGFQNTESNPGKIAIALYNGMWAYDGWNNLNYVTEEIINPARNIPLSVYIAVPLVTVLYILVNISYLSVLSVTEIIESPAVAVTWGNRSLGVMAWLIPLFVACSTIGAANGTLFASGRLTYVAAREGHMVELLSMIHVKRHTPLPSLVFTALLAILMVIPGNISSLIDFFSFAVWFFYGLTMVALIILRFTRPDDHRPYKVPIVIPIIVLIVSVFLVLAPIIDNPRLEFLYAFIFILAGLIFYFPFVYFKFVLPGTTAVTTFAQLLLEVMPAESEADIAG